MKPPVKQPVTTKDATRTVQHEEDEVVEVEPGAAHSEGVDKRKAVVVYNPFDALLLADDDAGVSERGPISSPLNIVT
ncbi:UNVERIFIED_CONTAM: hypothetical protein Sangu_3223800 [Sesamum angustifolium]|uniref:Uncharacterized protein n=1 Tax=Sesamum angustifolium TaxID=2727405 RepID=A0AAW2JIS9_9LAMI